MNGLCFDDIPEEIYTLELPKVPPENDGTLGWEWLQFLRSRHKEEFEMIAEKNPEIRKAVNTLYDLSASEKVQAEYDMRLKAWRDRQSQIDGYYLDGVEKGKQEGLEKGRQEGRQEGRLQSQKEIVKNALAKGVSFEYIKDLTGLDMETIKQFTKDNP